MHGVGKVAPFVESVSRARCARFGAFPAQKGATGVLISVLSSSDLSIEFPRPSVGSLALVQSGRLQWDG